MVFLLQFI